jgi:hypothetical protein
MDVTKSVDLGDGHKIEIGKATWDETKTQISIRDRYPTSTGGFSPHSSSELPLGDIKEITTVVAAEDLLKPKDLAEMIAALSASLGRQV